MKLQIKDSPRLFEVGGITIKDQGKIQLDDSEMVSMVTNSGKECDITATEWGFYLGSSLNGRMKKEGFKVALIINKYGRIFLNAVEVEKLNSFKKYCENNNDSMILCWLDEWLSN